MSLMPPPSEPPEKGMGWQRTVVVGAGPVGSLAALYAAKRGDQVDVYELRNDLRDPSSVPLNFTKSINLALSERGINSMRQAHSPDLLKSILDDTIPMHGRMIHGRHDDGKLFEDAQAYDVGGRAIRAADRGALNKRLLDELETLPNVKLHFNYKLTGADFKKNVAWFEHQGPSSANAPASEQQLPSTAEHQPPSSSSSRSNSSTPAFIPSSRDRSRKEEIEVKFNLMIGADGAHSSTRHHLMKFQRLSYQQEYIDTLWCEFHMTPDPTTGDFRISPHHLHIWPAGDLMFIAIPSSDKSFTCTLFMSASNFDRTDNDLPSLTKFFNQHFPGVAGPLIPEDELQRQYTTNPHLPLISIKCEPYHYGSSVVIVGDAAHAMVPFYGQGMNAGLEDVRVLFETLDQFDPPMRASRRSFTAEGRAWNRAAALAEYSFIRRRDAHTINDLAMGNYQEMRRDVTSRRYLWRKRVEEWLSVNAKWTGFRTQYSRVSFSNERYSEVAYNVRWQHAALDVAGGGVLALLAAGLVGWVWRWRSRP